MFAIAFLSKCSSSTGSATFKSDWGNIKRIWVGPEYWANPMQDWQLNNGRLECITSGGDRNLFLLTHELDSSSGDILMKATIGFLETGKSDGWVGFKLGVKGEFGNYRDSAVRGEGMPVGITSDGKLFIGFVDSGAPVINLYDNDLTLVLSAQSNNDGLYGITLEVLDHNNKLLANYHRDLVAAHWLEGGIALVCSATAIPEVNDHRKYIEYPDWGTEANTQRTGNFRFWFKDWQVGGSKVRYYPERAFGPILFTQFTVSNQKLKLTVQMPPLGDNDSDEVYLQTKNEQNEWHQIADATIDQVSRTATFRHKLSSTGKDIPYRVHYQLATSKDQPADHYFDGIIPKEPIDKQSVVVAAFTGNNDLGFPNSDLVKSVTLQNPDFLFFSGDQIYEGVGGYGAQRSPLKKAVLDYLRKWYMFGWTYQDLLSRIPSVAIPDDHDVYHGNIWGEAGKATSSEGTGQDQQDSGGYKMYPEWVNMVQKTQTSHLPDPFDPTPVKQGIGVYYTNLEYAGLSFAIIEDRKFKSAPQNLLLDADVDNGWAQNPSYDPATQADHPQAILLGARQHEFLNQWTEHWEQDTWMKVLLSQTIFANVATLPRKDAMHDRVVPQLRIMNEGEYAPDDIQVSDMDSNGWPQTGRDDAVKIIRKSFTFHIAGDQHLGSTIQYGVDQYGDAGYALCVPSVSNVFPRRWYPPINPETQSNLGNFKDGFGNLLSVLAVSNPVFTGRKPAKLYDRATGYGIVKFERKSRRIVIENWPRDADPETDPQYEGWPITINQKDNFFPNNGAYLPQILYQGDGEPLIQAFTTQGELVWSIRIFESSTALKVPHQGKYVIRATLNNITQEYPVAATKSIDDRGIVEIKL